MTDNPVRLIPPTDSKPTKTHKRRWSLCPLPAFAPIVDAMQHGVEKGYEPLSWQAADPADVPERYGDALLRHVEAWQRGETFDPDSGLPHLAHAGACVVILLWHGPGGGGAK